MTNIPAAICRISHNKLKHHISETKDISWAFHCISEMCMKFRALPKKDKYPSLIISEIIDAERGVYLNV